MAGYISEGIQFLNIAKDHCELTETRPINSYVSVVFSAMYIESVLNDAIYHDTFILNEFAKYLKVELENPKINIYNERMSFIDKVDLILHWYKNDGYEKDSEINELVHLMAIRSCLVHLKPIGQVPAEQENGGEPERKICRAALNYLHHNLKIIEDPYGRGVFWTDVIQKREVSEWAVSTVINGVNWLLEKTHNGSFGNHALQWQSILTKSLRQTIPCTVHPCTPDTSRM